MLQSLLTAFTEKTREVALPEAALYALLGFAIVFLGIAFLILIVWVVGKVMDGTTVKKEKTKAKRETSSPVLSESSEDFNEETIAVIMAALTAYYEQNNPKCEFTVKRIKRI